MNNLKRNNDSVIFLNNRRRSEVLSEDYINFEVRSKPHLSSFATAPSSLNQLSNGIVDDVDDLSVDESSIVDDVDDVSVDGSVDEFDDSNVYNDDDASTSNNDASQNIESSNSIDDQLQAFHLTVQDIESSYTVIGTSSDNNNNRAVNQRSNYTYWDNVQFHPSLVERAKESSKAPLVVPSHKDNLDVWLKELDSNNVGCVEKIRKRKRKRLVDNGTVYINLDKLLEELDLDEEDTTKTKTTKKAQVSSKDASTKPIITPIKVCNNTTVTNTNNTTKLKDYNGVDSKSNNEMIVDELEYSPSVSPLTSSMIVSLCNAVGVSYQEKSTATTYNFDVTDDELIEASNKIVSLQCEDSIRLLFRDYCNRDKFDPM